ncbi:MAG TPA: hypothetical protein VKX46_00620, partial [Ktedonobacteraceae bacterium]|nr:hypothetical protein [Ktedonobacteraceae bacterium]
KLRDELATHLSSLQRQGLIAGWYDGSIRVGSERDAELKKYLSLSDLVLLLISPDFAASDYLWSGAKAAPAHTHNDVPLCLRYADVSGNAANSPPALLRLAENRARPS